MNRPLSTLVLCLLAPFAACGMMGDDAQTNAVTKSVAAGSIDVNQLLGGIADAPSAEAAKGPLDTAIAALKGMIGSSEGAATEASGTKSLGADALATLGIDGDTMGLITELLANPAVTAVIGPALNQLKGLLMGQ